MTPTVLGAASDGSTPLPEPLPAELSLLQALRDYPAVSVLCTAEAGPAMSKADVARLGNLVDEAAERLRSEFGAGDARALCDDLRSLAADAAQRPSRGAVALYVSSHHRSSWALPIAVTDRATIDPTFATRDLVRSLHRTPRHVVLLLSEHEARLFDGAGDTLLPPFAGPFPLRSAAARRPARVRGTRSRSVQSRAVESRSMPSRSVGSGGIAASRRVTDVDQDGDAFLRTVDDALGTYLRLHPAPLVLVGAERTLSRFTHVSRNLGRLAGTVHGNYTRSPLSQLAELIRPILVGYLHSRQDEALRLLDSRAGSGRVLSGMPAVWLAARTERPEMLAVESGLFYPARLSQDADFITPATDVDHPDVIDDLVDEVIETVLQRGGWVALVDDGALSAHDGIALSVRRS